MPPASYGLKLCAIQPPVVGYYFEGCEPSRSTAGEFSGLPCGCSLRFLCSLICHQIHSSVAGSCCHRHNHFTPPCLPCHNELKISLKLSNKTKNLSRKFFFYHISGLSDAEITSTASMGALILWESRSTVIATH